MKVDLHTHTLASDGALSPAELIGRAEAAGVDLLAITDHDTVRSHTPAPTPISLTLVSGIELSTLWQGRDVHVVGLNIDVNNAATHEAVAHQQGRRAERAERIGQALQKAGAPDLHARARELAGESAPGRPHFAKCLVEAGLAKDEKQAFKRYLGKGRRGNVATAWADLATVIDWIRGAGGTAVLAHPARYALSRAGLRGLVEVFRKHGGEALEIVSGRQDPGVTTRMTSLAHDFGLLGSAGSDFHSPAQSWLSLGVDSELLSQCTPVWSRW
ncbi:MAG: PHP domain-containing protein [Chromatiales bacterium]|nr:PHP domain-containing protein [Chromatiales bacterium]